MFKFRAQTSSILKPVYTHLTNYRSLRNARLRKGSFFWREKFLHISFRKFRTKLQFWHACLHTLFQKKLGFQIPKVVWLRRYIKVKFFRSIRPTFFKKKFRSKQLPPNRWYMLLLGCITITLGLQCMKTDLEGIPKHLLGGFYTWISDNFGDGFGLFSCSFFILIFFLKVWSL